jgi:signal transduction histidine kinase/ligand-binding sensor domain-containing protein
MIPPVKYRCMTIQALRLLCLFLAACPCLHAERLPLKTYTSADGLGSSFVTNLMRDSRGFLWVCTRDGLSRFDGSRFVTYQIGDNAAPPGIEQILETRKGIYWIVTTGGLYRFDPAVPSADNSTNADRPTLNAEFAGNERALLFEDRDGTLWSVGDGLYRLEEKDGKLVSQKVELNLPANPSNALGIGAIVEGQDRSLWLLTTRGLVRRWPDGKEDFYTIDDPGANGLTSVLEDKDGRIWLGCLNGLYVIQPELPDELASPGAIMVRNLDKVAGQRVSANNPRSLPAKPGEVIRYSAAAGFSRGHAKFLYQTSDKRIWVSDGDRLVEFDGQDFQAHTSAQGLIQESGLVVEDGSGNLWLGNPTALMRFQRSGLTSYDSSDGLGAPYVVAINQTHDDKLYAITSNFSVSLFDANGFQTVHPGLPPEALGSWTSNAAFQDSIGEWWFLTTRGLYRFAATKDFHTLAQQGPRATYDHRDGLKGDRIFHIFEDSRHDLWISTLAPGGLSRWSRSTEKFYTFAEAEGFPPDKGPSSFAEDREGNLWFGFYQGGLVRYAQGRFTEFKPADGLPNGLITALHLDRQGRLWIGSAQSGLGRVDDTSAVHPQFVPYTTDSGLASNNVRAITEDLHGNVYAGTARGVDRLSPDGTRIKHYSVNDGLAGDFVTAAFRDHSGALWFGTPNGLSRLGQSPEKAAAAPPVWISGLRIAGERRPISELGSAEIPLIEMTHSQNNLQIDFFGIDFSAGETLRYQYRLEGADKEWSAPTLQRAVTYANMAPGAYRFLVRAVSADGLTSEKPATISFKIMPPVWQRWWFLSLAALVMTGIVYSSYRYRVAQLLKVERVRTRIATDLHDDIGASLSRMAILSEVVKQQTGGHGNQAAGLLTEIADSARGLVDSMGDIVWSIDPRRDDLRSVVQRIRQFASDVLEAKGISWELRVPPEVESLKLGPEERRHLFLIFKEGINNVARHGDGTKSASLSIKAEGRQLIGEIQDDGCGFTPKDPDEARSQGRGGNGLPNMRERAAQLGGRLDIASSPGAGTRLTLLVPIK